MVSVFESLLISERADIISIVESNCAEVLQIEHALYMLSHGRHGSFFVFIRIFLAQVDGGIEAHPVWHVAIQRIMRACLIGKNIWDDATASQLRNHVGAIANQANRNSLPLAHGIF